MQCRFFGQRNPGNTTTLKNWEKIRIWRRKKVHNATGWQISPFFSYLSCFRTSAILKLKELSARGLRHCIQSRMIYKNAKFRADTFSRLGAIKHQTQCKTPKTQFCQIYQLSRCRKNAPISKLKELSTCGLRHCIQRRIIYKIAKLRADTLSRLGAMEHQKL